LIFVIALLIVTRVLGALIGAFNSLPLVAPLMKLIGLGYSGWFIYTFLLSRGRRREFAAQIQQLRTQMNGVLTEIDLPNPAGSESISQPPASESSAPASVPVVAVRLSPEAAAQAPSQESEAASAGQLFAGVVGTMQVLIPLAGVVDVTGLTAKLQKDLDKVEAEIQSLSERLGNANFVDKAPAQVVQNARTALAEAKKQAEILRDRLNRLQN
jgi:valyl-tRNA synthetase